MAEMLSPGVFVTEIDASQIAPTVSNSIGVFAGNFDKGPVEDYTLITNVDELINFYGLPSDVNYNDWYQAYNFLQYANKLYLARAANTGGSATPIVGETLIAPITANSTDTVSVSDDANFSVGQLVSFGGSETNTTVYYVTAVDDSAGSESITLDRNVEDDFIIGDEINTVAIALNGVFEAVDTVASGEAVTNDYEYLEKNLTILNSDDFETKETSIAFTNSTDSKLKIIARSPGDWSKDLEIAIATPSAFNAATPSLAFDGIALDDLFEYFPTGTEVGVIIRLDDEIVETFTVDFDENAKDSFNKSTYIETVINNNSEYIFVKENTANTDPIKDYCFEVNGTTGSTISLVLGTDSDIQADDLLTAYELWSNKEEIDIDIVIANELDGGVSAKNLVEERKDCIAFIGAYYSDTVGKKATTAVSNLVDWRKTGDLNFNNMFCVACGNYKYQYDRYNDKNRWVNIAGDIAGLRAQTSTNRASWWASAGLERGQIQNVKKLAFNPKQAHRDILYKNGINPIVTFPGQGTVMWGQKTLLDKASSFDRVNVRGLFNTLERSLSKMAKYQVMEFNDNFTRNRIVSMIKPFLSSVQAGRGIQDFLVICDTTNNTADVISRNQLVVDIYIKPTYVAEFIHLRFTNAGTNSFAEVIGG
ncbi:tail sheath [Vibrio phage VB_VaC_TDDLMA]